MPEDHPDGIGLCDAIVMIREELLAARNSGENADIRLPVTSVTVELQVVATSERGGKAGFKVPLVNLELGGSASRGWERTSMVTVVFGTPTGRDGEPVHVTESSSEVMG